MPVRSASKSRAVILPMATLGVLVLLASGGCTVQTPVPDPVQVVTSAASGGPPVTPIGGGAGTGTARSTQVSAVLFTTAPVVVVASTEKLPLVAASAAVSLGVPLLDSPTTGGDDDLLRAELDRLGAATVLTIGPVRVSDELADDERDVIPLGDNAATVASALGITLRSAAADQNVLDSVAAIDPLENSIVGSGAAPSASATPSASASPPVIPEVRRGEVRDDSVAIVSDPSADVAAAATARAAGADVVVAPEGSSDLFDSDAALDALGSSAPASVLVVGDALASDPSLAWKVQIAVSKTRLPGGGVRWFPDHTLVALYGVPGSSSLGVLGEQDVAQSVIRAQDVAAPYVPLTGTAVVPTFEIITTVAAGEAGGDGDFSNEVAVGTIAPWVQAAADNGMQVILDLQPSRTDFLTQAQRYQQLLELPNVGLALDPEWRLAPDQVPLGQIGTVSAAEVNSVTSWLADLTRDKSLPQKLLVLHQFRTSMISDRATLDTSRDEVALLIHVDGQGGQPAKQATWNALHVDAPDGVSWGWKNFYDEDTPPLTPDQTMSQVMPPPNMISYQ